MNKNNQINPVQTSYMASPVQTLHAASLHSAEKYTAPDIEIIDIELQQNILGGSTDDIEPGGFW